MKEDELLSRLEMLENQLHVYSRKMGEDELRKQLAKALEEKQTNNISSKVGLFVIQYYSLHYYSFCFPLFFFFFTSGKGATHFAGED